MGISAISPSAGGDVTEIDLSVTTADDTPTTIWTDTAGPRITLVEAWVSYRETGIGRTVNGVAHIVAHTFVSDEGSWSAAYETLPADDPQSPQDDRRLQAAIVANQLVIQVIGNPSDPLAWLGKLVVRTPD